MYLYPDYIRTFESFIYKYKDINVEENKIGIVEKNIESLVAQKE